jgi:methionyl-tRNA formyltransferase
VVIAFAQFLSEKILTLPKLGCFNIHTSLLPKYRGAAPIQYAILNGDEVTGVSIQKMVKKMDAGDIGLSLEVPVENRNSGEMFAVLSVKAAEALSEFIDKLKNGQIEFSPQDESQVSYAPSIKKQDGLLKFSDKSALESINQIRAFTPWPGTFTFINNLRVKVHMAEVSQKQIAPNTIEFKDGDLLVGCKEGSLHLRNVQLDGKKATDDKHFLNGMKNKFSTFEITENS